MDSALSMLLFGALIGYSPLHYAVSYSYRTPSLDQPSFTCPAILCDQGFRQCRLRISGQRWFHSVHWYHIYTPVARVELNFTSLLAVRGLSDLLVDQATTVVHPRGLPCPQASDFPLPLLPLGWPPDGGADEPELCAVVVWGERGLIGLS